MRGRLNQQCFDLCEVTGGQGCLLSDCLDEAYPRELFLGLDRRATADSLKLPTDLAVDPRDPE
ncbi:MAG: hypothetical protein JHC84_05375 [Solirubrobacteraceae bacterium]|nr:hypothetical protein [Solirubrobacteraceae bacterium]